MPKTPGDVKKNVHSRAGLFFTAPSVGLTKYIALPHKFGLTSSQAKNMVFFLTVRLDWELLRSGFSMNNRDLSCELHMTLQNSRRIRKTAGSPDTCTHTCSQNIQLQVLAWFSNLQHTILEVWFCLCLDTLSNRNPRGTYAGSSLHAFCQPARKSKDEQTSLLFLLPSPAPRRDSQSLARTI